MLPHRICIWIFAGSGVVERIQLPKSYAPAQVGSTNDKVTSRFIVFVIVNRCTIQQDNRKLAFSRIRLTRANT